MIFVWKGYGGLFPVILIAAAVMLLPFEGVFSHFGAHPDVAMAAAVAGITASVTLFVAQWLEHRDRKQDKSLDIVAAQKQHTLYWVSLTNWGYLATLTASALFIYAVL